MKHAPITVALLVVSLAAAGCSSEGGDTASPTSIAAAAPAAHRIFFGWVLGSPDVTAVAVDVTRAADGGAQLAAYVCDGLGPPAGKALWFASPVDPAKTSVAAPLSVRAAGAGADVLSVTQIGDHAVLGTFASGGTTRTFAAYPATGGAGIYQVSVREDRTISGLSTDGSVLTGTIDAAGATSATITTASKQTIDFTVKNLSLATPTELAEHGLSDGYTAFKTSNQVPGEYVAVIAPGGSHWLGRAGAVRLGDPRAEIIGLDKKEFRRDSVGISGIQQVQPR